MHRITADQVTPAIRSLFRWDQPQARRCFAVLDGSPPQGKILVDDPLAPTWAAVMEMVDNSLYFGGRLDAPAADEIFAALRQEGDVLVGMWPDDPRLAYLPTNPAYDGWTLEFYDRPIGAGLEPLIACLPPGCALKPTDRDLVMRTAWGPDDVRTAGSLKVWEQHWLGFVLLRGDEILSEASSGPPTEGVYEPGVITQEAHRGNGYATLVSARLVQEIEARGGRTYWNCAIQNLPSAAVARKLGYRVEKKYRCMLWEQIT